MASYYYSLLGMVRVRKLPNEWIVEVSYKDETVYSGQYNEEHKWHYVGTYATIDELNKIIETLCKEESKRGVRDDESSV
jgi:hypothetical protein